MTEVAKELGVTRQTVWEWKSKNPYFVAEFNQRKEEFFSAQGEKLLNLIWKALDVVKEVLKK
ncbi:phBC6A51 family helix-turn-helix protein [Thermatribacter velox]|uniref:phBC6A51 family helix-turn-helix protein n=1 Tax=Thermatribacter velox TaxID=3039681 RepID=UPI0034D97A64